MAYKEIEKTLVVTNNDNYDVAVLVANSNVNILDIKTTQGAKTGLSIQTYDLDNFIEALIAARDWLNSN